MKLGINTTSDISKLSQISYNNFEISLVVFMLNITTNHAITYTNPTGICDLTRRGQLPQNFSVSKLVVVIVVTQHLASSETRQYQ